VRRVLTTYTEFEIDIEWDAPSSFGGVDLLSYEVWLDDGAGDFSGASPVATLTYPATTLTLTDLTPLTTYGIKMTAIN